LTASVLAPTPCRLGEQANEARRARLERRAAFRSRTRALSPVPGRASSHRSRLPVWANCRSLKSSVHRPLTAALASRTGSPNGLRRDAPIEHVHNSRRPVVELPLCAAGEVCFGRDRRAAAACVIEPERLLLRQGERRSRSACAAADPTAASKAALSSKQRWPAWNVRFVVRTTCRCVAWSAGTGALHRHDLRVVTGRPEPPGARIRPEGVVRPATAGKAALPLEGPVAQRLPVDRSALGQQAPGVSLAAANRVPRLTITARFSWTQPGRSDRRRSSGSSAKGALSSRADQTPLRRSSGHRGSPRS
jgi:hypothetical protein